MAQKITTKAVITSFLALTLGLPGVARAEPFEKVERLITALNSPNLNIVCTSLQHELDLTNLNIYYLRVAVQTTSSRETEKLKTDLEKLKKLRFTLIDLQTINHCI